MLALSLQKSRLGEHLLRFTHPNVAPGEGGFLILVVAGYLDCDGGFVSERLNGDAVSYGDGGDVLVRHNADLIGCHGFPL